jgi:two-component sensor histidine kinase
MSIVSVVDIAGSALTIVLSFYAAAIMRRAYLRHRDYGLYTYLYAQTIALAIFAASRSVGHIANHILITLGMKDVWAALSPISGSINSFTFVIFGLAAILYSNVKDASERMDYLRRSKADLHSALTQREVLIKEVHHRVKNNLAIITSLLTMQARQIMNEESRRAFEDSRNRVMAMALVHEKLYQSEDLREINVRDYLKTLLSRLLESHGGCRGGGSCLEVDADVSPMGLDTLIPCGLVVNELVTNALKHAFTDGPGPGGRISVTMKSASGRVTLTVEDNGVGLPKDVDPATAGTLGLQIVESIAGQLEADLAIDRTGGTRFTLTFTDPGARSYLAGNKEEAMV